MSNYLGYVIRKALLTLFVWGEGEGHSYLNVIFKSSQFISWQHEEIQTAAEENQSLPAILQHSVCDTLERIKEEFAHIQSESGTRIVISKLRRSKDDKGEFDIMSDKYDIRIPEDIADSAESAYKREERQHHIPASDFSLRVNLFSILVSDFVANCKTKQYTS